MSSSPVNNNNQHNSVSANPFSFPQQLPNLPATTHNLAIQTLNQNPLLSIQPLLMPDLSGVPPVPLFLGSVNGSHNFPLIPPVAPASSESLPLSNSLSQHQFQPLSQPSMVPFSFSQPLSNLSAATHALAAQGLNLNDLHHLQPQSIQPAPMPDLSGVPPLPLSFSSANGTQNAHLHPSVAPASNESLPLSNSLSQHQFQPLLQPSMAPFSSFFNANGTQNAHLHPPVAPASNESLPLSNSLSQHQFQPLSQPSMVPFSFSQPLSNLSAATHALAAQALNLNHLPHLQPQSIQSCPMPDLSGVPVPPFFNSVNGGHNFLFNPPVAPASNEPPSMPNLSPALQLLPSSSMPNFNPLVSNQQAAQFISRQLENSNRASQEQLSSFTNEQRVEALSPSEKGQRVKAFKLQHGRRTKHGRQVYEFPNSKVKKKFYKCSLMVDELVAQYQADALAILSRSLTGSERVKVFSPIRAMEFDKATGGVGIYVKGLKEEGYYRRVGQSGFVDFLNVLKNDNEELYVITKRLFDSFYKIRDEYVSVLNPERDVPRNKHTIDYLLANPKQKREHQSSDFDPIIKQKNEEMSAELTQYFNNWKRQKESKSLAKNFILSVTCVIRISSETGNVKFNAHLRYFIRNYPKAVTFGRVVDEMKKHYLDKYTDYEQIFCDLDWNLDEIRHAHVNALKKQLETIRLRNASSSMAGPSQPNPVSSSSSSSAAAALSQSNGSSSSSSSSMAGPSQPNPVSSSSSSSAAAALSQPNRSSSSSEYGNPEYR